MNISYYSEKTERKIKMQNPIEIMYSLAIAKMVL